MSKYKYHIIIGGVIVIIIGLSIYFYIKNKKEKKKSSIDKKGENISMNISKSDKSKKDEVNMTAKETDNIINELSKKEQIATLETDSNEQKSLN